MGKCNEEDEDCREKSEIIKRQADEEESDEVERLWSMVEERQKRSEQTEEDLETKTEEETQTETSETRREKRHATTDLKSIEEKSGELNGEEEVVKCDEEDEDCRERREATTPAVVEETSEGRQKREVTTETAAIEMTSEGSRQKRETKEKMVKKILKLPKKKYQKLGKSQ